MNCTTCKKNIFETAKAIATGTMNYVFDDPEIEAIALPRLKICSLCQFNRKLISVGSISVFQCTKCNCLNELKTRDKNEVCPVNKW